MVQSLAPHRSHAVGPAMETVMTHTIAKPASIPHPVDTLIAKSLPAWLRNASDARMKDYLQASRVSLKSAYAAHRKTRAFKSPEAFCRPLLQAALDRTFPHLKLDADRHELIRMTQGAGGLIVPRHQTLLQAAMQNFEPDEARRGGIEVHSLILPVGKLGTHITEQGGIGYIHNKADEVAVTPEQFASLVRNLDLGAQYQAHFKAVFRPMSSTLPSLDSEQRKVTTAIMQSLRDRLGAHAIAARLQGHIDESAYLLLNQITRPTEADEELRWAGEPVRICQLRLLHTRLFAGHSLQGAVLIEAQSGIGPCLVYIPSEPQHPLMQYTSAQAFADALREKLRHPDYVSFIKGLMVYRSHEAFGERLSNTLAPTPIPWPGQFTKPPVADPNADIGVHREPYQGSLSRLMYNQYLVLIAENARTFVVPVEDEDELAWEQRLAWWKEAGMFSLNVLGFVPVLGEMVAAYGLIEMVKDVCIGVDDRQHGQRQEALEHFSGVMQNVAMIAAGAAGGLAFARSPFMEAMDIVDTGGRNRLVHPELPGYAADIDIPQDMQPDSTGQYVVGGQAYVDIDGQYYRHFYDQANQQWVIASPHARESYRPVVERDGHGNWRHAHQQPLAWQGIELLKRSGAPALRLNDVELAQVLEACGVPEAQLRQAHFDRQPLPPAVLDSLQRVRAQGDVDRLVSALKTRQPLGEGAEFCLPLAVEVPGWPSGRGVRVIDAEGKALLYGEGNGAAVQITHAEWRNGDLAKLLLAQLTADERTSMFSASVDNSVEGQTIDFSQSLAMCVERNRTTIAKAICDRHAPELTEAGAQLQRIFPNLSHAQANLIAEQASEAERLRMTQHGKVPTRMAEQALMALREQRLTKACEGLSRLGLHSPDRDTLALKLLEQLPGWTGEVRIELRAGGINGELLAQSGGAQAPDVKYIVRRHGVYQAYDALEQELSAQQDLFSAICAALPDREIKALKLARSDANALAQRIAKAAAVNRTHTGQLLGQRQVQPWFRAPYSDPQGVGYPLSGRQTPGWRQQSRLRRLYPSMNNNDLADLAGSLPRPNESLELAIRRLEQEFRTLQLGLEQWEREGTGFAVRRHATARIVRAWRRESTTLDLRDLIPGELPVITADFSHTTELYLEHLRPDTDVSFFLGRFPNLRTLALRSNHLREIPAEIASMKSLQHLNLNDNNFRVTDDLLQPLRREDGSSPLISLQLHLAFGEPALPLTVFELTGRMLEPLSHLHRLKLLDISSGTFRIADDALNVIGSLSQLETLRLGDCFLSLEGERASAFSGLTRLHTLDLSGSVNGLGSVDITHLRNLVNLSLHECGLTEWPQGLSELMQIRPLRLRVVALGHNLMTQLPELRELEFVRARSTYLRGQVYIDFGGNPLNAESQNMLRRAGLPFRAPEGARGPDRTSTDWLIGCPEDLRSRIDADRNSDNASAFYRIMDQTSFTGGYQQDPQGFRARMWDVMRAVVPDMAHPTGDGLGVVDLRQQLFERATLINQTCEDGISIALDDFETRVAAWQAASSAVEGGASMFAPLLRLARQLHKAALVDEYAVSITQTRMNRRRALLAGESTQAPPLLAFDSVPPEFLDNPPPDEVEIRLMLRDRLQATLDLRPQPVRLYAEYLTTRTIRHVGAAVREQATDEALINWLVDQPFWEVYLRKVYESKFDTLDQFWAEVMSHFEDATDGSPLPEEVTPVLAAVLARLSQIAPSTNWRSAQGRPLRVTVDEQQLLQLYNAITQARTQAHAELIKTLSQEVVKAQA